jgi:glucokinase
MASVPKAVEAIPFPVLIGDIGGTNARFALLEDARSPASGFASVATGDFETIEAAIEASVLAHTPLRPRAAIVDLAGPIVGDAVDLTNADWIVRPPDVMAHTGIEDVILLNDFEALALALTSLEPSDLTAIGGGPPTPDGAKAVVGPGTGLGVGALVQAGGLWVPVPGEGGHVSLGPAEDDEFPLWTNLQREHGRIEAETLLSGRGFTNLYRAVAKTEGGEALLSRPADITQAALSGSDILAARTVELYCRMLGRFAGDVALTFMARGGLYVGGGISPRIMPFLQDGEFRRAFEAKAPHGHVMATIPAWVITSDNPALAGLAAFAQAPEKFGVALTGRRWRK